MNIKDIIPPTTLNGKSDKHLIKELKLLRRELLYLHLFFLKGKYTSTTIKEYKDMENILLKRLKEFK